MKLTRSCEYTAIVTRIAKREREDIYFSGDMSARGMLITGENTGLGTHYPFTMRKIW